MGINSTEIKIDTSQKPCIELYSNGLKKLETFFKLAATKEETAFMEINPEDNVIKLNCIDPAHITNTIIILDNNEDEDFLITKLDKVLQFNVNSKDFNKLISLNADKSFKIYPDIDEKNNFDMIKINISENNVSLRDVYLPIYDVTNTELIDGTIDLVNNLLTKNNTIIINMNLQFLNDILKESEIFMNERLRWNVSIKDKGVQSLSIETFDSDTDKTRRIKNNLFEGLHFTTIKINIDNHKFNILVSFSDLKRILTTSNIYNDVKIFLAEQSPICIMYAVSNNSSTVENTLTSLLAPIIMPEESEQS